MTDRLSALLHQEADQLDVPLAPVRETLAAGRQIRRRRRLVRVVAVAATVGVVAGVGVGTAALLGADPRSPDNGQVADPAPVDQPVDLGAVFGFGDTVYLEGGASKVRLPEIAQSFYYSTAGLLVRTNATGASDGGAPFHFQLIHEDESVTKVDVTLGEVVPSTDPYQPYLAYAEATGGGVQVVVHDLDTGRDVARVDVPEIGDWGGWEAPPVVLTGNTVLVRGKTTVAVDWHTGEVVPNPVLDNGLQDVQGTSALVWDGDGPVVVDLNTGKTLLAPDPEGSPWIRLSPDGRYAQVNDQTSVKGNQDFEVYDLGTGEHAPLNGAAWTYGWTANNHLVSVTTGGVDDCQPIEGRCTGTPLPEGVDPTGTIVMPGIVHES